MIPALVAVSALAALLAWRLLVTRRVLRYVYDQRTDQFCTKATHREHWSVHIARDCTLCDYSRKQAMREARAILERKTL